MGRWPHCRDLSWVSKSLYSGGHICLSSGGLIWIPQGLACRIGYLKIEFLNVWRRARNPHQPIKKVSLFFIPVSPFIAADRNHLNSWNSEGLLHRTLRPWNPAFLFKINGTGRGCRPEPWDHGTQLFTFKINDFKAKSVVVRIVK